MRVVIAGGHGQIALRLERLLAERGDTPVGLVRNPDHFDDVRAAGAEPVLCDLERASPAEVSGALTGADAVVFAAGAVPGSGAARKETMDRAGAALLADAAQRAGVRRYLLVSSMGEHRADLPGADPVFAAYLRAKAASEADLRSRDLDVTILRPGRLTDDPGTGRVRLAPPPVGPGDVSRDDVATVLLALLDRPDSRGQTLELVGATGVGEDTPAVAGGTPIRDAISRLST